MIQLKGPSAIGALVAVLGMTACGGGARSASVPASQTAKGPDANQRVLTERGRRYLDAQTRARAVPVDAEINDAAAKHARVFRIEEVAVFDPATNRSFNVSPDEIKRTADGIVLFEGANQIVLSKQARVLPKHYTYIFRHGAERDPGPESHAERIR